MAKKFTAFLMTGTISSRGCLCCYYYFQYYLRRSEGGGEGGYLKGGPAIELSIFGLSELVVQ